MEYEKIAHMVVFGETFSGKTYFTKYLINRLAPTKVYVFTGSPHEWDDPQYTVYTDSFDENAAKMIEECTKVMGEERKKPDFEPYCPHVVVFDDFNEEINTRTNELYKSLYTRGRHYGIRVVNLAHQSHAIGPLARANARYVFCMSSTSETELEELANLFYGKMHLQLKNIARKAYSENKYNCVVIDKRSKQHVIECAPNINVRENKFLKEFNIEIDTEIPNDALIAQNPALATYHGVGSMVPPVAGGPVSNIGTKSAHNLYDNSTNNFNVNHNIKMKQLIEANNVHNDIKMQNMMFEVKLKLREDVLSVRDIIHKPFKTPQEKEKLVHTMNKTLRPSPPFTLLDYEEGIPMFMEKYFKESYNINKPRTTALVERAGDLFMSGNDPLNLAASGWGFLQTVLKRDTKYDDLYNDLDKNDNKVSSKNKSSNRKRR